MADLRKTALLQYRKEHYYKIAGRPDPNDSSKMLEPSKDAPVEKLFKGIKVEKVLSELPRVPYVLSAPPKDAYLRQFPYENQNTPFEDWEVNPLQYQTLINNKNRGVLDVRAGDNPLFTMAPLSPAVMPDNYQGDSYSARSGTATPQSEREPNKARTKLSFADYKAGKRPTSSSSKIVPGPNGSTSGSHSQNGSISSTAPKDLPPPSDTQKLIDQIIAKNGGTPQPPRRPDPQPTSISSNPSITSRKSDLVRSNTFAAKDHNKLNDQVKINDSTPATGQNKRPHESAEPSPPEKRTRVEKNNTTKRPSADNFSGKKSPVPQARPLPPKPIIAKHGSSTPSKLSTSMHANESRSIKAENRKSESDNPMPALLSPLPAGLVSPEQSDSVDFSIKKIHTTPPKSPKSKISQLASTASHNDKKTDDHSPPISPLMMPELLSPNLPDWVEAELDKIKEKQTGNSTTSKPSLSPTAVLHGVQARRDRSRQPDTPGVARKTTKQKNSTVSVVPKSTEEKKSLIVKLRYSKRNAKNIKDLLRLRAHPANTPKESGLGASSAFNIASRPDEKKRARPNDDTIEPPAKRSKAPDNLDIQKSRTPVPPAFKSPAFSTPSSSHGRNAIFGTPKKGDAMKSVTMRKINSSDGAQVRTPQAAISTPTAATPASAEKVKPTENESMQPRTEIGKSCQEIEAKFQTLGVSLKREGDALHKSGKDHPKPPPLVSDADHRLGTILHLEALTAFMVSFQARDAGLVAERHRNKGQHWGGMANGLMIYVEGCARRYPELHAFCFVLDYISREYLERLQMERLLDGPPSAEYIREVKNNVKCRARALSEYAKHHEIHEKVRLVTTVDDAKQLAVQVLGRFAREHKVDWESRIDKV